MLIIEGDGGWLIYNEGTPFERRERYPVPGRVRIFYRLSDPPATHRGRPVEGRLAEGRATGRALPYR